MASNQYTNIVQILYYSISEYATVDKERFKDAVACFGFEKLLRYMDSLNIQAFVEDGIARLTVETVNDDRWFAGEKIKLLTRVIMDSYMGDK